MMKAQNAVQMPMMHSVAAGHASRWVAISGGTASTIPGSGAAAATVAAPPGPAVVTLGSIPSVTAGCSRLGTPVRFGGAS
jgi:hypothetical protein